MSHFHPQKLSWALRIKNRTTLTSLSSTKQPIFFPSSRQFAAHSPQKLPISKKTEMAAQQSNQSFKLENLFNVKNKGKTHYLYQKPN